MRVGRDLLVQRDVVAAPFEQEIQGHVDDTDENRRVCEYQQLLMTMGTTQLTQNALPERSRAQDALPPKKQIHQVRARLHERIHNRVTKPRGTHRRRQRNKHIHLLIQLRMYTERRERLRGPLREPNIRQRRLSCRIQNITDRVRNIIEREIIHRELPKLLAR